MADDLERFLQEAADRLAKRVNQSRGQRSRAPSRPKSIREAERARVDPQLVDPDLLDAEIIEDMVSPPPIGGGQANKSAGRPQTRRPAREEGPNPLSRIDTRRKLAGMIDLADERMAKHIEEALGKELPHLREAVRKADQGRDDRSTAKDDSRETQPPEKAAHQLLMLLRSPVGLRAAFLASEIFQRKF